MSIADALEPAEAAQQAQVLKATFGHLAPSIRKKYKGSILFAQGEYGDLVVIRADFPSLPNSPWLHDHLQDFVAERAQEAGKVYRFDGSYMMFKNGNPSFKGEVTQVC
jgi:hypothetical protein